ncbi:MAG: PorT family protein [Chlorobi bacterium]|nr:PorT family protein [Chlorobiota bacterium]
MKVLSTLILILFSQPQFINGQIFEGFGIKAGFTSSNIEMYYNNSKYESMDRNSSFHFAVFKDFLISIPLLLNTELEYSTKGFDFPEIKDNVEIDCLSFKVLGKYILDSQIISPYISIGPRLDYIFNKRANLTTQEGYEMPLDWANYFTDFSFGLSTQFGIESRIMNSVSLLFEFSYNYDLSNSTNGKHPNVTFFRNNSFDISLGLKF